MEQEENQLIETVDEEGNIITFELFDIVEVDEQEYALLLPSDPENEEESELIIMRLTQDGEDYNFETIDDDEEFNKVAAYIEELQNEDEEEDE